MSESPQQSNREKLSGLNPGTPPPPRPTPSQGVPPWESKPSVAQPFAAPPIRQSAGGAPGADLVAGLPMPLAPIWTRTWCWFLDSILALLVTLVVSGLVIVVLQAIFGAESALASILGVAAFVGVFLTYFAASYVWWSRTPMMMLGRLYVLSVETFEKVTWGRAYLRALVLNLAQTIGIIALIWIILTSNDDLKRGPHDKAGRSIVLRRPA